MINGYGTKEEFYDLIDLVNSYITANKLNKPKMYSGNSVVYQDQGIWAMMDNRINDKLDTTSGRLAYKCRFVYVIGRKEFILKVEDGFGVLTRVEVLTEIWKVDDKISKLMDDLAVIFDNEWQTAYAVNYHAIGRGEVKYEYIRGYLEKSFNRLNAWADSYA